MSLLVDLQLVPNRILEVVKARILANRAKLTSKQQMAALVKGATRPRPQRQKFNAKAIDYRRPEPAAVRAGVEVAGFTIAFGTNTITIGTKDGRVTKTVPRALRMSWHRRFVDDEIIESDVKQYTTISGEQYLVGRTLVKWYDFEAADYDGYSRAYAFPLDGTSCIVVVVDWFHGISIKRQTRLTTTEAIQWAVEACGRAYQKLFQSNTTKEGGELSVSEANDKKIYCFRVAKSSITEIPPPPAILDSFPSKLIEWQEGASSQAVWQEFRQVTGEADAINACREYYVASSTFFPDVVLGDMKPGQEPWPDGDWRCNYTVNTTLIRPGDYLDGNLINPPIYEATVCQTTVKMTFSLNESPYNRLPKIAFRYVRNQSTGAAPELDNWNPWGPPVAGLLSLGATGAYVTPGIFGPLNGVTADSPGGATGAEIAKFYGLENVAPKVSVVSVAVWPESGPVLKKQFDVYLGLLPVPSDPDPFSKLRKNPSSVMSVDALAVWDWGRPGYCRQKLKEIGLFPDPPPAP